MDESHLMPVVLALREVGPEDDHRGHPRTNLNALPEEGVGVGRVCAAFPCPPAPPDSPAAPVLDA